MSPLRYYLSTLWIALRGDAGFVYVRSEYLYALEARVAEYQAKERAAFLVRSNAQKNRKANKTSGPVEGGTGVPLAGPQEINS